MTNPTTYKGYQITTSQNERGWWSGRAVIPGDRSTLMEIEGGASEAAVIGRLKKWIDSKSYTAGGSALFLRRDGTEITNKRRNRS